MADMQLDGMDQLLNRLQLMGRKASAIENEALLSGAEIIQDAASKRAPRSSASKDHLAYNIIVGEVKRRQGMKIIEVGPTLGDNSEFFYGKFHEFGTSKMPAHPFMGPAAAESQGRVLEAMKRVVRSGLGL
ncbi:HK97-gp10 family putative phage morphogenesis protein [Paenibacillus sp. RC84]|uniref:HK97-gp10 family putative phage morphogenesis protein n=1 Tax=Paenibacillus sp. RC84 TaxID=3156252 RepID=UPI0035159ED2